MSYKPTNEELIAYLYGELEESTLAQIEQYLADNPEAKASLEGMEETRVVMSQWDDEEVPLIPGFMQPHENSEWLYWRKYVAVAATLLLVIGFGWAAGFRAGYGDDGFQIGFGKVQQGLSATEVNQMLDAQQQELIAQFSSELDILKDDVGDEINLVRASNDNNIRGILNGQMGDQRRQIVAEMNKLNDDLTEDYREIFRQMVVSFSNNYEDQRIQDLRKVEIAFNDLQDAIGSKQEVLEEALYNLSLEVEALAQNNN